MSFVAMEAIGEYGGMVLDQTRPVADVAAGYTYFRDGDVLTAKITPCFENGKATVARDLVNGIGFGTTELHVLRPHPNMESQFLFYVAISHAFRHLGTAQMYGAGGQKRVPEDFVKDYRQPVPPLDEQRAIAAFLDRETARIDALIERKRRQIELLHEKRSALISHAVTKGLDPTAPMKDSGIDWLGKVPEHWEVKRLRLFLQSIEQGWSPQCEARQIEGGTEWGVLKVGCVNGTTFDDSEHKALPADLAPLPEYEIKVGDVLLSRANTRELLGSAAYVHAVRPRLHLCDKLYRIRTRLQEVAPRFLVHAFRSCVCRYQFERAADGASGSMKNIGQETVKNTWMLLPPLTEQEHIVEHIACETGRIDRLLAKVDHSITMLREHRTALISAAVTGKIDVRSRPFRTRGLCKRLISAAEYLCARHDAESALIPICNAIDRVSKDIYGKSGRSVYKRFIHDRMELITRVALNGVGILNANFAVSPFSDGHGNEVKPQVTDENGRKLYSFQQIVYHLVRCKLDHDCEVSEILRDNGIGSGQFSLDDGTLSISFDAIAHGLLFAILSEVDLRNDLEGSIYENIMWKGIPLIELIGDKKRFADMSRVQSDPCPRPRPKSGGLCVCRPMRAVHLHAERMSHASTSAHG